MKAVGLIEDSPTSDLPNLQDLEIDRPIVSGRDLLVAIKAIAVNPVDTKVRSSQASMATEPRILGWDAAGVVVEIGDRVTKFKPGDEVYYAGDLTRPGSNSEFQLVDERIVGYKPQSLDFTHAAALPLTSITAWEGLFDRLKIDRLGTDAGKSILIINGAGGVGSIAIQLAKLAQLEVIATASRPETSAWCQQLGADYIVNHYQLGAELERIDRPSVDYIFCLNNTDEHWQTITTAIKPQGKICAIVQNKNPLAMELLKQKSATLVWEFMFTRSMYQTADLIQQGELLDRIAQSIDRRTLVSTCKEILTPINAANLNLVHQRIEAGQAIGKIVLSDWD